MKILKEYKEPTTIIITGQWVEPYKESLMVTDDECFVDVRKHNGEEVSLSTFGFVTILTEDEFNEFINSEHFKVNCDNEFSELEYMYRPIKDYVGTIGVSRTNSWNGEEESDDWDIDEYFYHQFEDSVPTIKVLGEYDFDSMTIDEVKKFLSSNKTSKMGDILSRDEKESIKANIVAFGMPNSIYNGTFEKTSDKILNEMAKNARKKLNEVSERLTILLGLNKP